MRSLLVRAVLLIVMSAWLAANAGAATLAGVSVPDSIRIEGQTLVLNGLGLRTVTFLNIKIYVAALYLPRPSHDARQILATTEPKVLLLTFLHAGSKQDVEKRYREGEMVNCGHGGCRAADEADFERLVAAAPGVKIGDTATYIFTAQGVRVLANNQPIGDFANPNLALHLLAGFIGDHPPSPELRSRLLGLSAD